MLTKEILKAFVELHDSIEVLSCSVSNDTLSFAAPKCYLSIIVDTFEPTFGVVSYQDVDPFIAKYDIQ